MNAKFHVAAVLRDLADLLVQQTCSACKVSAMATIWPFRWDEVQVERKVGSRRPDVTLLQRGAPVAAVEVFATNEVSVEKAAVLAAMGLPWLEVRAAAVWRDDDAWTPPPPLPVHRVEPGGWRLCARCLDERERAASAARVAAELAAREVERRRAEEEREERLAFAKLEAQLGQFRGGPVQIGRTLFLALSRHKTEWTIAVKVFVIRVDGESAATVLTQGFVRRRGRFEGPHRAADTSAPMDSPAEAGALSGPSRTTLAVLDDAFRTLLSRWQHAGISVSGNDYGDDLHVRPDPVTTLVLGRG